MGLATHGYSQLRFAISPLARDWDECLTSVRIGIRISEDLHQLTVADVVNRRQAKLAVQSFARVVLKNADLGAGEGRMKVMRRTRDGIDKSISVLTDVISQTVVTLEDERIANDLDVLAVQHF